MHPDCLQETAVAGSAARGQGGRRFRRRGALVFAGCAAPLILGCLLVPRKSGYGTHEALGLAPCSFLIRTGYPCPTCGMTTSLAAMCRADVLGAFHAHPFGPLLWAGVAVAACAGALELAGGRNVLCVFRLGPWWLVILAAGTLVGWGLKVLIGLALGELPIR